MQLDRPPRLDLHRLHAVDGGKLVDRLDVGAGGLDAAEVDVGGQVRFAGRLAEPRVRRVGAARTGGERRRHTTGERNEHGDAEQCRPPSPPLGRDPQPDTAPPTSSARPGTQPSD